MPESLQPYYFIIVALTFFYALRKAGLNKTNFLIIIVFWEGLFQYLDKFIGNNTYVIYNYYKIFVVTYALIITNKNIFAIKTKKSLKIFLYFILFSITFWISYFLRGGEILTIGSQYLYKFSFPFIIFQYLLNLKNNTNNIININKTVLIVLFLQIILSILKIVFSIENLFSSDAIGNMEPIVGSMSAGGAGLAVVIPIVGLLYYWGTLNGNFNKREWLFALSLIIIAFASMKRQPIFFFPLIIYLLTTYVKKGYRLTYYIKYVPLIIVLVIIGIKINPSLNPDNKVWGRFDPIYAQDYVLKYYFGSHDLEYLLSKQYDFSFGRGSGLFYLFSPDKLTLNNIDDVLFGKGRYEVAIAKYGRFTATGRSDYGLEHKGLIGEAAALIYSIGYLGTIFMLLYAFSLIRMINNKKLSNVLLFYYLWDFILYYNQVIFSTQSAIIIVALILKFYSNHNSVFSKV